VINAILREVPRYRRIKEGASIPIVAGSEIVLKPGQMFKG
jgi:hypothetical protein